ncbi:MAG: nitrilase-related carbon-nitrogen hydrolase [Actinomycetota bacterium]
MTDAAGSQADEAGSQRIRVAACQLSLAVTDVAANRAAARDAIVSAAGQGAQVVVLPELVQSGYVFASAAQARSVAEPADGPTVTEWGKLAAEHDLTIVAGFCELGESGTVLNSAVVLDATGTLAVYRKAHLWDAEPDFFRPGASPPPVVRTRWGRIAVMVCYDLEFPEWVRAAALAGADLLAAPTNWPAEPVPPGERPMMVVNVQAAAAANRMFIAAADRCGTERGVSWVGGTVIAGVDGYPLAGPVCADRPRILVADCDLRLAREKANGPRNNVHGDRRPELYS